MHNTTGFADKHPSSSQDSETGKEMMVSNTYFIICDTSFFSKLQKGTDIYENESQYFHLVLRRESTRYPGQTDTVCFTLSQQ